MSYLKMDKRCSVKAFLENFAEFTREKVQLITFIVNGQTTKFTGKHLSWLYLGEFHTGFATLLKKGLHNRCEILWIFLKQLLYWIPMNDCLLPLVQKGKVKCRRKPNVSFPTNIYLFKVNNRKTQKRSQICSKLTMKTPERRQFWCFFC